MIQEAAKQYPTLPRRKSFALITAIMSGWGCLIGVTLEYFLNLVRDNPFIHVKWDTELCMAAAGLIGFYLVGVICAGIAVLCYTIGRTKKYVYLVFFPVFIPIAGVLAFPFYWVFNLICLITGYHTIDGIAGDVDLKEIDTEVMPIKRNTHIDVLKGLAMMLLIVGHTVSAEKYLGYSIIMMTFFAIPLYFMISGYLLSSSASRMKFTQYLRKRVIGTVIPYILFFAFSFVWVQVIYAHFLGVDPFTFPTSLKATAEAFFFSGNFLYEYALVPQTLWFLHAQIVVTILFYFVAKIKKKRILVPFMLILFAVTIPIQNQLKDSPYWILKLLAPTLFFMSFGYLLRMIQGWYQKVEMELKEENASVEGKKFRLVNSFASLALFLISMRMMQYGRGDIWSMTSDWYFPAALLFGAACYLISRETSNKILQFTGRYSLYYMGLHPLVLELAPMADLLDFFHNTWKLEGMAGYLAYFIVNYVVISLLVLVVVTIKNWLQELFRKAKEAEKPPMEAAKQPQEVKEEPTEQTEEATAEPSAE